MTEQELKEKQKRVRECYLLSMKTAFRAKDNVCELETRGFRTFAEAAEYYTKEWLKDEQKIEQEFDWI